jgi:acyl carrier protein
LDRTQIEARLKQLFHSVLGLDPSEISAETSPDNVARWDSLQHLALVTSIEEEFGISIDEQDILEMLSFGLAIEIVASTIAHAHR